jgi:hypothetical protein
MIQPIKIKTPLHTAFSRSIFVAVFALLMEEAKQYYQQHLHYLQNTPSPVPHVTESDLYLCLAAVIQMGYKT